MFNKKEMAIALLFLSLVSLSIFIPSLAREGFGMLFQEGAQGPYEFVIHSNYFTIWRYPSKDGLVVEGCSYVPCPNVGRHLLYNMKINLYKGVSKMKSLVRAWKPQIPRP